MDLESKNLHAQFWAQNKQIKNSVVFTAEHY